MSQTTESSHPPRAQNDGSGQATPPHAVQLTPEQQRTLEAVQKFLRDKEEAWAKMSQVERDEAEAKWEEVAKNLGIEPDENSGTDAQHTERHGTETEVELGPVLLVEGTTEQRKKNQAALDWLKRRREGYDALSPERKDELERQWEAFERLRRENPVRI